VLDVLPSKKKEPVRVDWKLPARLRRPVAAQLAKDRKKKHQRQAIVRFERKNITTPKVWNIEKRKPETRAVGIALPTHHFFHTKPEQHTGDTMRDTAPKVRITLPPYGAPPFQGGVRGGGRNNALPHPTHPPLEKGRRKLRIVPKKHTKTIIPKMPEPIFAERDIAYEFAPRSPHPNPLPVRGEGSDEVTAAQVSLPFSVSVWSVRGIRSSVSGAVLLLIGCAVILVGIWSLQGAGRGTAVVASLQQRTAKAFADVTTAQAALAHTDTTTGEQSFQSAFQELTTAQKEMDQALAASKHVLAVLDLTGTVRAGQDMLEVGSALAKAGEHTSRAMKPFFEKTQNKTLTDAITASRPELALAQAELDTAAETIKGISGTFLPPEFQDQIEKLQTIIPRARNAVHTLHSESETFLTLLGAERDRQYLFLFANNDEMRPVGGFIGTVGLVNIDRGRVENIDVHSVYDGDGQLKEFLAPPNPLLPIVSRWYLRDSNWFVDFSKSAQKAAQLFEKEGGPTVDGVVLMTPTVIRNLLAVTGPIEVPGYANVVSAENFVEVTQGEVTYDYDKSLNKPKQFLSDLTPILLTKLFASSPDGNAGMQLQTLGAFTKSLAEKDLLFYFKDENVQKQADRLGWAGTLSVDASGFLMVNNANIGGHKSDQFIEQEIDYRTTITEQGDADVVVTVRRTHKGPDESLAYPYPEGENPAFKINTIYQRMLVPKGAILLESKGFTAESDVPRPIIAPSDIPLKADADIANWQLSQHRSPNGAVIGSESGYTFFANWIVTRPGETSVTLTHYRIPDAVTMPSYLHPAASYSMAMFKQPGQRRTAVRASMQVPDTMKIVHTIPASGITRESDSALVYRGQLTSDVLPGIVFERK